MAQAVEVSIPSYHPGDVAGVDVIAPFEFAVVNSEQTERLRQTELQKVPAIYRFNPWIAVQAEEKLSLAFSKVRLAFFETMEKAAGKRSLDEATIAHPSFWRFVDWFKAQHPAFPLTTNIASAWALGDSADSLQFQLQSALRAIMSRYIRADAVPVLGDSAEVQLVTVDRPNARLTPDDLDGKTEILARPQILTLSEAHEELVRRCAEHGPEVGSFVATFLKENLAFDDWLTTQKRQRRASELVVFDQYSPGQLVVRTGQIVDTKAKAALEVLATAVKRQQARTALSLITESDSRSLPTQFLAVRSDVETAVRRYPWLLLVFAGFAILIFWRLLFRRVPAPTPTCEAYTVVMNPARNETVFLPVTTTDTSPAPFSVTDMTHLHGAATHAQWQIQFREAEQRAEELLALVRAGLAPHLAKELTHKLVQELVCQRATLLRAHQLAEQEIVALEARFDKVHRELQERVAAYEKRTSELEKELIVRAEQTRELMNATILLTKQKLGTKKAGDEFACN